MSFHVLALLTDKQKKDALFVILIFILSAILDLAAITTLIPFFAAISDFNLMKNNYLISIIFESLNLSRSNFLVMTGILVFIIFGVSLCLKAYAIKKQYDLLYRCEHNLIKHLAEGYLGQPYDWYLKNHSIDLSKNILSEVNNIIAGALMPLITFISQICLSICIFLLLLVVNFKIAIVVTLCLICIYGLIYLIVKNYLVITGDERLIVNKNRFIILNEMFASIKDIKILGCENYYLNKFNIQAKKYALNQAKAQFVIQLPRYFVEAFGIGGILLLTIYLITIEYTSSYLVFPLISIYVFCAYRLMPAFQQIYACKSQLKISANSVNQLVKEMSSFSGSEFPRCVEKLSFKKSIIFHNICFTYENSQNPVLNEINLKIPFGSKIAFVGKSGSGKTTAVNILLGLLNPSSGAIVVDDVLIDKKNVLYYKNLFGHVPQNIYISDDSIIANIAFGQTIDNVNLDDIVRVAKIANLHDFVVNELQQKYETKLGESGIRLSGGQRQRLALARALFRSPHIIVVDEGTSALDGITEKVIIDSLLKNNFNMTTIFVAHRINTIRNCDYIYLFDKGKILSHGTYDNLMEKNEVFRRLSGEIK